jgi:hypothetical protein
MPLRLYLVNRETGRCTGKKRDYPSEEHFKKYGRETYHRYNAMFDFHLQEKYKAKLCFLNDQNKWEEVSQEKLNELLNK